MKIKSLALAAVVAAAFSAHSADKVKIGFVSTLSGPSAGVAIDVRDGFQLAVKLAGGKLAERNERGKVEQEEPLPIGRDAGPRSGFGVDEIDDGLGRRLVAAGPKRGDGRLNRPGGRHHWRTMLSGGLTVLGEGRAGSEDRKQDDERERSKAGTHVPGPFLGGTGCVEKEYHRWVGGANNCGDYS